MFFVTRIGSFSIDNYQLYFLCSYLLCSNCVVSGGEFSRGMGKKIFIGRLPQEATADDLRQYFGRFGRIMDVYIPRVKQNRSHGLFVINMDGYNLLRCDFTFNVGPEEKWP